MIQIIAILRRLLPGMAAAVLLASALQGSAWAESALDRIRNTGVLNAGTRADSMPFAYRLQQAGDKEARLAGFSVDLIEQIRKKLTEKLGREIETRLHITTASDRLALVASHTIDIECGITTPTWERQKLVDFSIPFFGNGTRLMVLRKTAKGFDDLRGKRIGVAAGTTTSAILKQHVPDAIVVEVPDMATGFKMFSSGELDGLSNVGIVLRALVEKSPLKSKVILLPRTDALSYESMACSLPLDDSKWRAFVNEVLAELLDGIDQYRGGYFEIYDKWFGPRGIVYFPLDYIVAQKLSSSIIWLK
ncbi:MAG: amino acid ABC transporter substrate-binding protein [Candidatus Accumulibacter cognatus]|uniref:Amino acid ABC transporter substrate-binding protein n=1 Tax=Candidatus Accumulibacter cognatus TaxID=2954383 RepID=A0A7D5N942_9PROT|nr:MAG: amino acid ABC transporter substrate-binding protein [Candidatus Accumulibacter cognatus]